MERLFIVESARESTRGTQNGDHSFDLGSPPFKVGVDDSIENLWWSGGIDWQRVWLGRIGFRVKFPALNPNPF